MILKIWQILGILTYSFTFPFLTSVNCITQQFRADLFRRLIQKKPLHISAFLESFVESSSSSLYSRPMFFLVFLITIVLMNQFTSPMIPLANSIILYLFMYFHFIPLFVFTDLIFYQFSVCFLLVTEINLKSISLSFTVDPVLLPYFTFGSLEPESFISFVQETESPP